MAVSALSALTFVLAVTMTPSPLTTPTPPVSAAAAKARNEFLVRVDAAFAARDSKTIEALADVASWREAGYPELASLKMLLPEGPLTRYKDLSDASVLYHDGSGRSWCLRLRPPGDSGVWKAVIRGSPCPRGGARVAPQWKPGLRETPSATIWTLLECWPLPV
jgi:hypothetical protein